MFEYPEIKTLVRQMKNEIINKKIHSAEIVRANSNMFCGKDYTQYQYDAIIGGTVVDVETLPHDIFIKLDNGWGILICQSGGKLLFNETSSKVPKNYNIIFNFTDNSSLTYTMNLFTLGLYAYKTGDWQAKKQNDGRLDPLGDMPFDAYISSIKSEDELKKPIKLFLVNHVMGISSTFAAEILLYAKIHPSVQVKKLSEDEQKNISGAMKCVLTAACDAGGRNSEYDLYGQKGGYEAAAERKRIGADCPLCGATLLKHTTGGVTAYCPVCQTKKQTNW